MPAPTVATHEAQLAARRAWLQGLALAVLGAVFFSGKAIVAKLMYREGIDPITLVALRMLLSVPFFVVVLALVWRHGPPVGRADLLRVVGLGLTGYYLSSLLDFMGMQYISAGLERLILFLTPSFVLLMSWLLYRRRVGARQWLSMAFAYAGILLVFQHDLAQGGDRVLLGTLLVLAAAFTYALYLMFSGEIVGRVGTLRLVSLAMTACCVATLTHYALVRPPMSLFDQNAAVWQLSAINAVVCTVLPVFLIMAAIARIGAGPAAQAGMTGPVSTLLLAWWILGEPLGSLQLAGTALVLAGIVLLSRSPAETAKAAESS